MMSGFGMIAIILIEILDNYRHSYMSEIGSKPRSNRLSYLILRLFWIFNRERHKSAHMSLKLFGCIKPI